MFLCLPYPAPAIPGLPHAPVTKCLLQYIPISRAPGQARWQQAAGAGLAQKRERDISAVHQRIVGALQLQDTVR